MAPRKKARANVKVNRRNVNERRRRVQRRKKTVRLQPPLAEPNIEEWVYRFLGNLAAIEANKSEARKNASLRRPILARGTSSQHRIRSPTPYSWDKVEARSPVDALRHPMDSAASLNDDDDDITDAAAAAAVGGDYDEPMPRIGRTSAAMNSRREPGAPDESTLLEKINLYIKAGIAEGKRRAKRYVRKALAFALEMGYLVPADRQGKLLRVSSTLVGSLPSVPAAVPAPAAATTVTRRKSSHSLRKRETGKQRRRSRASSLKRAGSGKDRKRKADDGVGKSAAAVERTATAGSGGVKKKKSDDEGDTCKTTGDGKAVVSKEKRPPTPGVTLRGAHSNKSRSRSGNSHQETSPASAPAAAVIAKAGSSARTGSANTARKSSAVSNSRSRAASAKRKRRDGSDSRRRH